MHIAVSITLSPTLYAFEAVPDISYLNHHDPSPHTAAHDSGHYSDIVENLIHGRYPGFYTFKCSHHLPFPNYNSYIFCVFLTPM